MMMMMISQHSSSSSGTQCYAILYRPGQQFHDSTQHLPPVKISSATSRKRGNFYYVNHGAACTELHNTVLNETIINTLFVL